MTVAGAKHLDLDDSYVLQIRREPGRVTIELEQCRHTGTKRLTVDVTGVTLEDASHFVGHNITAPHPNPASPLDYVQFAEQRTGEVVLEGHLRNKPWYVWRLVATGVDIVDHDSAVSPPNNSLERTRDR